MLANNKLHIFVSAVVESVSIKLIGLIAMLVVALGYYNFSRVVLFIGLAFLLAVTVIYLSNKHTLKSYLNIFFTDIYLSSSIVLLCFGDFFEKYFNIPDLFLTVNIVLTICVITTSNYKRANIPQFSFFQKRSNALFLLLCTIIFMGAYLRAYHVESISLWTDEATSVTAAERISAGYEQTLPDGTLYSRSFIYHHYLGFLFDFFPNIERTIARLANIPAYIFACFMLYKICFILKDRFAATIAIFMYSFSWYAISMAREARFYEFFIALLLLFTYFLILFLNKSLESNSFIKDWKINALCIAGLLVLFQVSSDGHASTALMLYAVAAYGLFYAIFYNFKKGLVLFSSLGILIIAGVAATYKSSFKVIYLFKQPAEYWKTETAPDYSSMISYLGQQDVYFYILLSVTIISIPYLTKRKEMLFFYTSTVILYLLIALQGYGASTVRYFYICLPFFFLSFSMALSYFTHRILHEGKNSKLLLFGLLLTVGTLHVVSGNTEARSALTGTSKNQVKNINYVKALEYLAINSGTSDLIVTDTTLGNIYYEYFKKGPDFVVSYTNEKDWVKNMFVYPYTNTPVIHDYSVLNNVHNRRIILIVRYLGSLDSDSQKLIQGSKKVFDNGVRIFVVSTTSREYFLSPQ